MTFSWNFSDIPGNASGYGALADALLTPVMSSLPTGAGLNYQGGVTSFTKSNASFISNDGVVQCWIFPGRLESASEFNSEPRTTL
jgi:hypothetical protein